MASSIKWLLILFLTFLLKPWFIPLASHSVFKSGRVERVFDICSRLCFLSLIFSGILESCFQLMMAKTVRIQSNFTKLKPWPREFEIVRFAFKQSRRFMSAFFKAPTVSLHEHGLTLETPNQKHEQLWWENTQDVTKKDQRDQNRQELSSGHDPGKGQRAKNSDGRINTELTKSWDHTQSHNTLQDFWILCGQLNRCTNLRPAIIQVAGSEDHAQEVATQHHL